MTNFVSSTRVLFLSWLLPGLGHRDAGMKKRGRFYMMLLLPLFIVGETLARGGAMNFSEHPYYFVLGQWWCGSMAVVGVLANLITGGGGSRFETYEIGQLFVTSAMILNILVAVDLARRIENPARIVDR